MAARRWIGGGAPWKRGAREEGTGNGKPADSAILEEYRELYQKYLDRKADSRIEPFLRLLRANDLIECGTNPRDAGLDTRIKIQKFVYFAQECFGLKFRYRHTLYIYGPYSPELANDYYRIDNIDDIPDGGLDDWNEREKFLDFARAHNDSKWLEIAGTLLYIHRDTPLPMDDLIFRAKRIKRKYSREHIAKVCNELTSIGFMEL